MVRTTPMRLLVSASLMLCLSPFVSAQPFTSTSSFAGSGSGVCVTRCDHVIEMIRRHGVNNTFNRLGSHSLLSPWGMPDGSIADGDLGDLQIVAVNLHPEQDAACGPRFAVVVRNDSTRKICGLRISAVAVFGQIRPTSPNVTFTVESIGPGESLEASLQLPINAYAMGNRNGAILGYQQLIVAVDSYDEFLELDEANNIRSFPAAQFNAVVVVNPATTVIESASESVASPPPAETETAVPQASSTATPMAAPDGTNSTSDGISTDQTNQDSLRQAIDRLALPTEDQSSAAVTQ